MVIGARLSMGDARCRKFGVDTPKDGLLYY
jgi:hypothetical protein